MPENKKADDFSVDDIIKDVMRKKRRGELGGFVSSNVKSDDDINVKKSNIKTEDVNSKDYFKSFYDDSKTSNSADKKRNIYHTNSQDALQSQKDYLKKSC